MFYSDRSKTVISLYCMVELCIIVRCNKVSPNSAFNNFLKLGKLGMLLSCTYAFRISTGQEIYLLLCFQRPQSVTSSLPVVSPSSHNKFITFTYIILNDI